MLIRFHFILGKRFLNGCFKPLILAVSITGLRKGRKMVATTARVTRPFLHNHKGLRLYYLLVLFTHSCEAFTALLGVTKMRDILFKGADWLKKICALSLL